MVTSIHGVLAPLVLSVAKVLSTQPGSRGQSGGWLQHQEVQWTSGGKTFWGRWGGKRIEPRRGLGVAAEAAAKFYSPS